ncbi:TetR/AcrR family transcriptional regulator [Candidatus Reidiella endopervernicosa]|uniref:TetR/AcrR family transcriptional regulator n=1 Tax=Candidatus Reidiella endopervernicosa TaxID=2738883 RepID=A0A6N0HRY0_9GAMM|nr:TetR/AcrR family transcriptional regulator [Candidatus Reidiella endopervernicosa]QKQ25058.1 TetR/AcrR family transcriptional regulator [Candidatus Reidiella endopervernicosa]
MARRSDHSREEIKEMALAAAEHIVAMEGCQGLSARKIAKAIGYTVGTLYLVFKNLEELILHVNARTLDTLYAEMVDAANDCETPEQCVMALGNCYIHHANSYSRRWGMIYEHITPEGEEVPDWYQAKVSRMFALVERALEPMTTLSDEERKRAARVLWSGVHGICNLQHANKLDVVGESSGQELAEALISNYLKGISA